MGAAWRSSPKGTLTVPRESCSTTCVFEIKKCEPVAPAAAFRPCNSFGTFLRIELKEILAESPSLGRAGGGAAAERAKVECSSAATAGGGGTGGECCRRAADRLKSFLSRPNIATACKHITSHSLPARR